MLLSDKGNLIEVIIIICVITYIYTHQQKGLYWYLNELCIFLARTRSLFAASLCCVWKAGLPYVVLRVWPSFSSVSDSAENVTENVQHINFPCVEWLGDIISSVIGQFSTNYEKDNNVLSQNKLLWSKQVGKQVPATSPIIIL